MFSTSEGPGREPETQTPREPLFRGPISRTFAQVQGPGRRLGSWEAWATLLGLLEAQTFSHKGKSYRKTMFLTKLRLPGDLFSEAPISRTFAKVQGPGRRIGGPWEARVTLGGPLEAQTFSHKGKSFRKTMFFTSEGPGRDPETQPPMRLLFRGSHLSNICQSPGPWDAPWRLGSLGGPARPLGGSNFFS